jgi:hypothetical protein
MKVKVGEWLKLSAVDRYMEIWRNAKNNSNKR